MYLYIYGKFNTFGICIGLGPPIVAWSTSKEPNPQK